MHKFSYMPTPWTKLWLVEMIEDLDMLNQMIDHCQNHRNPAGDLQPIEYRVEEVVDERVVS